MCATGPQKMLQSGYDLLRLETAVSESVELVSVGSGSFVLKNESLNGSFGVRDLCFNLSLFFFVLFSIS